MPGEEPQKAAAKDAGYTHRTILVRTSQPENSTFMREALCRVLRKVLLQ